MSEWDAVLALAEGKEPAGHWFPPTPRPSKKARTVVPSRLALPNEGLSTPKHCLSSSWDGTTCSKYKRGGDGAMCATCLGSRSAHVLVALSPASPSAAAYCILRNVRCHLVLQHSIRSCDRKALQRICKKKKNRLYPVEVVQACQTLLQLLSEESSDSWWKCAILACDAAYNQLHYWELTTADKVVDGEDSAEVPPPMAYFTEWQPDNTLALPNPPPKFVPNSLEEKRWLALSDMFGLSDHKSSDPTHVLEVLHRARMQETYSMLENSDSPKLVREWRDSCRDFLCHLYAYATLSSESLQGLREALKDAQKVVEVGAGTGYIAHLFAKTAVPITAYDFSTGGHNEYHAQTPHFMEVKDGDAANVNLGDALILCYPPTDNNMAEIALNRFRSQDIGNDRVFVHIGEFKGLTGTRAFERTLLQHFTCIQRWPCRTWGTDASEVTIWKTRSCSTRNEDTSLLVPCSWCGVSEAKLRCKVVRCLSYCSKRCFDMDSPIHQPFLLHASPCNYAADQHNFEELVGV